MTKALKKLFHILSLGTFSLSSMLCMKYGMPVDMNLDVSVKTINELNEAIPGLQVQLTNNGERVYEDLTNDSGSVFYSQLEENGINDYKVIINDIDSIENGGTYKSQVVDIVEYKEEYFITMTK